MSVLGGQKLDEIGTFVWKIQTKEVWQALLHNLACYWDMLTYSTKTSETVTTEGNCCSKLNSPESGYSISAIGYSDSCMTEPLTQMYFF